jgi:phospholipid/cholesterol/gamma-HCH transport system substrate-binding protein
MESNKRAVIVGIFIIVGLAFLVAGILVVGNLRETFKRKISLYAVFEDVGGLKEGNNIWFSGVKVGTVNNIKFYGRSQVSVTLNVETTAQPYIRKDAKVSISTDGLIGNKIIVITGGSAKKPQVDEGDTLKVQQTFSSDDMMNTLQENNKTLSQILDDFKVISSKLAMGQGNAGKFLHDSAVYMNIEAASASLQSASLKANQLVGSLATFSNGLNKEGTLANSLVTDTVVFNSLSATVEELEQMSATAKDLITSLNESARDPKTPLGVLIHDEEAGTSLKTTLKNLESSSVKLDENLEAAKHSFLLRGYFRKQERKK